MVYYTIVLLFAINLINYLDRYLISGSLVFIQKDLGLSDTQCGALMTAFVFVYMAVCPIFGWLGDRFIRKYLISCGVLLWSLAGIGTYTVRSYIGLLCCRATAGIGESSYATTAPTVIADITPMAKRGFALSFFYLAIPLGSALGFMLGGWFGKNYSWRYAFLGSSIVGTILALLILSIREPLRGVLDKANNPQTVETDHNTPKTIPWKIALPTLYKTPSFFWITLGLTSLTFAMGGMAHWMPLFFHRSRGIPADAATLYFGGITVLAGILGTILGGWLGDRYQKKYPGAYFGICSISMFLAVPFTILSISWPDPNVFWPSLFLAEFCLFLNTGPGNTIIANVVSSYMRATAFAVNTFCIHLLGDAISPTIIGCLSDTIAHKNTASSSLCLANMGFSNIATDITFQLEKTYSLAQSLYIMPVIILIGGFFFYFGIPHLAKDTHNAMQN